MNNKYTTITIPREVSAEMRKMAIDENMRMVDLIKAMIEAYKQKPKGIDFIEDDLKEMKAQKKPTKR